MMMKYMDDIDYIRRGGMSRNGRTPDRLIKVIFIRKENVKDFSYLLSKDGDVVCTGSISRIVTVNGVPYIAEGADSE